LLNPQPQQTTINQTVTMFPISTITCSTLCFGRDGYNKNGSSTGEEMANQGRGGYNRGPDDDEPEDGRGGYN